MQKILSFTIFAVAICAVSAGTGWAAGKPAKAKAAKPTPQPTIVLFDGKPIMPMHGSTGGLWVYAQKPAPQLALMGHPQQTPDRIVVALEQGQRATLQIPLPSSPGKTRFSLLVKKLNGSPAMLSLSNAPDSKTSADIDDKQTLALEFDSKAKKPAVLSIDISALHGATAVSLGHFELKQGDRPAAFRIIPQRRLFPEKGPVACSPAIRPNPAADCSCWTSRDARCACGNCPAPCPRAATFVPTSLTTPRLYISPFALAIHRRLSGETRSP